jgi:membrane associated rhomboid family serine protease
MRFRFPVTVFLIFANVVVFVILAVMQQTIMMDRGIDLIALLHAGANFNPFTVGGEYWRLFTSLFIHIGIVHLLVNMFALWSLGRDLEPLTGSLQFALLFLICGVAGSIASLFFNVFVISAGASGAIFGLYGYWLAGEVISNFRDKRNLMEILFSFIIFVVIQYLIAGVMPLDTAAHVGGAVAGAVIAVLQMKTTLLMSWVRMLSALCLLPFSLFFISQDQLIYYKLFQQVLHHEQNVKNHLSTIHNDEVLLDSLKADADKWESLRMQVTAIPDVNSKLRGDTSYISKYIALTALDLEYKLRLINQSYIYLDSLETISARFDSIGKLKYHLNYDINYVDVKQDTTKPKKPSLPLIKLYYDQHWRETEDISEAKYFRIGSRDSLRRWQGAVRDYFMNGDVQMKGSYKDDLRDGVFIYYSDHKTYSSAGLCRDEFAVGKWEEFHWNGKIEREAFYEPRYYVKTIWDSVGNQLVSNGTGTYKRWFSNGTLAEEGRYRDGQQEGYWYGFHPNGEPYFKELYNENRLVSGASRLLSGKQFVYDGLSEYPVPAIGTARYNDYLKQQISKHPMTDSCSGSVRVLFTVGPDGSLWDFTVLRGLRNHYCNQEAIRIVSSGPQWRPALRHGNEKLVQQTYVDVTF